jgi:hypothetical protein
MAIRVLRLIHTLRATLFAAALAWRLGRAAVLLFPPLQKILILCVGPGVVILVHSLFFRRVFFNRGEKISNALPVSLPLGHFLSAALLILLRLRRGKAQMEHSRISAPNPC